MKNLFLLVLLCLFVNCSTQKKFISKAETYENFSGFEPIDPIEYDAKVEVVENKEIVFKNVKLLTREETFSFLNNETVLVSIGHINLEGKISYIPITISAKGANYKITMDYMKFATLGQRDSNGKFLGYKRVGIGLRLISQITTFESGINIGDISSIGIAAKMGKLNGTLMIEVIGIKSKDVTNLLPLPSEINQSTIQSAMQSLATIKSKIYDQYTDLYPQVLAIKMKRDSTDSNNTIEENRVKLQFENNQITTSEKLDAAGKLVNQAFGFFFEKDIDKAISAFDQCEKAYPQFYTAIEINMLLKQYRGSIKENDSKNWPDVASILLQRYSWKLSDDIKTQLAVMAKSKT